MEYRSRRSGSGIASANSRASRALAWEAEPADDPQPALCGLAWGAALADELQAALRGLALCDPTALPGLAAATEEAASLAPAEGAEGGRC